MARVGPGAKFIRWMMLAVAAGGLSSSPAGALQEEWVVVPARSDLVVHVFAGGFLEQFLHDHHLRPQRWSGRFSFDPTDPSQVDLELTVDAGSLRDFQPALSEEDRATVEQQVSGPGVLDGERHPEIRFQGRRFEHAPDPDHPGTLRGELVGTLRIRGVARDVRVPMRVRLQEDAVRARGLVEFKQTDFGIEPYSRFLGTVRVRDMVAVEFELVAISE